MFNTVMVQVPGAELYCKLQGNGPLLFMIAGGSGDADSFDAVAAYLEKNYTVLTYDRRGYARSPLTHPDKVDVVSISTQRADAEQILVKLSTDPAYVFGSSLGAVIGLDLLLHDAKHVRSVIAHEPPLVQLLSSNDSMDLESRNDESADETLHRFAASLGIKRGLDGASNKPRHAHNSEFFIKHEAPAVGKYQLDFVQLEKYKDKLTFAGGEEGQKYSPYRCARLAADKAQVSFVEFPGKHNGFGQYPQEFAEKMTHIFSHKNT